MNVNFDLEEQGNENNGTEKKEDEKSVIFYETPANVRKLTLELLTGERYLFDYADLSRAYYSPEKEIVILFFGAQKIKLKGKRLDNLFDALCENKLKLIKCNDERYATLDIIIGIFVYEIQIED